MRKRYWLLFCILTVFIFSGCAAKEEALPREQEEASAKEDGEGEEPVEEEVEEPVEAGEAQEEERSAERVFSGGGGGSMSLEIPPGWESKVYSIDETDDETDGETDDKIDDETGWEDEWFGIGFWPSGKPEYEVIAKYYFDRIGICGTGVTSEEVQFPSGLSGTKYTEGMDGEMWMNFFYRVDYEGSLGSLGSLMADASMEKSAWNTYEDEILDILGSMEFFLADEETGQICGLPPENQEAGQIRELPLSKQAITLEVEGIRDNILILLITNRSEQEFTYGMGYYLEKETDGGGWEEIPWLDGYGYHDIAAILPGGETVKRECDLDVFGELEPGNYRIWLDDNHMAEFVIK